RSATQGDSGTSMPRESREESITSAEAVGAREVLGGLEVTRARRSLAGALDRQNRMPNPITDGQLTDEAPSLLERMLAATLAAATLFLAYRLRLLPWQSLLWGSWVMTAVFTSTACVFCPEYIGDWFPESTT